MKEVDLMFFFKKKVKEPQEIDHSDFKVINKIDLKPYDDLKYDLVYAHDEILVDNDDVIIAARKYKKTTLKFMIVHDFRKLNDYKLDSKSLNEYADKKGYLEYIQKEDLDSNRSVEIIIFKENNENIKKYCFLNSKTTKEMYKNCFVYDHDNARILEYRKLRDFGTLREEYLTALFFDLACIDKEMY